MIDYKQRAIGDKQIAWEVSPYGGDLEGALTGGPAVYKARVMLVTIDSVRMNYGAYCAGGGGSSFKDEREKDNMVLTNSLTSSFAPAPNPAKEIVNITYNINENTVLVLNDLTGRVINTITLQQGKGLYPLDVHNLSAGTYILKAYSTNCNNCFAKLIQVIK